MRAPSEEGFDYKYNPGFVFSYDEIGDRQVIDARCKERYLGKAPEPRPTIHQGHYKGAKCIFFKEVVDTNWCYKSKEEILKVIRDNEIDLEKEVVFYCGSGVSCCIDILAFALVGKFDICRLYDGSWAELGNLSDTKNLEALNYN